MLKGKIQGLYKATMKGLESGLLHGADKGLGHYSAKENDVDAWKYIQYLENNLKVIVTTEWKNAINALVVNAKAHQWWDACDVIYPFVGGSAASNGVNMKNPGGATDIVWHGIVNHSIAGSAGNGSTGYGDSGYNPSMGGKNFIQDSAFIASYVTDLNNETFSPPKYIFGLSSVTTTNISALAFTTLIGIPVAIVYMNTNTATAASYPSLGGFLMGKRVISTAHQIYLNGEYLNDPVIPSLPLFNGNWYVMARNDGGSPQNFSKVRIGFLCAGGSNNSISQGDMYSDIENFQLSLGRSFFG